MERESVTDPRAADARVAGPVATNFGATNFGATNLGAPDARASASGTAEAAPATETATVTPLDQVLWSVLAAETAPAPFARAWLALLCRMLPGVARAVLVLRQDGV